jgi:hypothetical protein
MQVPYRLKEFPNTEKLDGEDTKHNRRYIGRRLHGRLRWGLTQLGMRVRYFILGWLTRQCPRGAIEPRTAIKKDQNIQNKPSSGPSHRLLIRISRCCCVSCSFPRALWCLLLQAGNGASYFPPPPPCIPKDTKQTGTTLQFSLLRCAFW